MKIVDFPLYSLGILCLWVMMFLVNLQKGAAQSLFQGRIVDAYTSAPLAGVSIKMRFMADSSSLGTSSDEKGAFMIKPIKPGAHVLLFSLIGYQTQADTVDVHTEHLPYRIKLLPQDILIDEIVIKAPQTLQLRGDTLEFDAKQISTRAYADADELVGQVPGIEIDEEGNVIAHGEAVTKIIVDGKEFFSTDPRIALKSLPAEIIDKIQLIDEKSEQAQFTGFDDGRRTKIINIVTKPDRRQGVFGKSFAALGDPRKFNVNTALNTFQNERKISVNLMANNVNETNFAEQGRGGNRRGNSNTERGLSDTYAAAVNFSNSYLDKTMETSADYQVKYGNTNTHILSDIEYILGSRSNQTQHQRQHTQNKSLEHRANGRLKWNIDSIHRLDFKPSISYQTSDRLNVSESSTQINTDQLINTAQRDNKSNNSNINLAANLTYLFKFKKVGRSASIYLAGNKSSNDAVAVNLVFNRYFKDALLSRIDTNDTHSTTDGYGSGYTSRLAFTENISRYSRLQAVYSLRNTAAYSNRETYAFLAESGQLGELRERLSNEFNNDYTYHNGGLSYAYHKKDSLRIQMGINYQYGLRNNERLFPIMLNTVANFKSFLPEFTVLYHFNPEKRVELNYQAATNSPTINQLQDYVNNQNPLRISNGNPNLEQEYNHGIKFQYRDIRKKTGRSLNVNVDFNYTNDKIINAIQTTDTTLVLFDDIILGAGGQYSTPVNVDGAYNIRLTSNYGTPIKKWKINLNVSNNIYYSSNFSVLNEVFVNSSRYGLHQRVGIATNISKAFVASVNYGVQANVTNNPLGKIPRYTVTNQTINSTLTIEFWRALLLNSSLLYVSNGGVMGGPSTETWLWNLSLGRKILPKKNAELALKAFDIFNNASNISRRVSDISISDVTSNTLNRYFLLSFTYHIRQFGAAPKKGQDRLQP